MFEYSYSDFAFKYDIIFKRLTRNKCVYSKPTAYILGGQPGAGKTPSDVERNVLFGKWNGSEYEMLNLIIRKIQVLKKQRNASDLAAYIKRTDNLLAAINNKIINQQNVKKTNLTIK